SASTFEQVGENKSNFSTTKNKSNEIPLRKYRLALACTGEYGQRHGRTIEGVLSSYNTVLSAANEIFEREVGIRLVLVEDIEALIFLNADTDPYQIANDAVELVVQNPLVLNNIIPPDQYEIGHVFTTTCTGAAGIGSGVACNNSKAAGVSCHNLTNLVAVARGLFAHEIGHQFTTGHSFNNCPGNEGARALDSAFEPGSGSTIMSYNGSCASGNNITGGRDAYYHVGSLDQFIQFTREESFGSCGILTFLGNTEPVIEWTYEDGFYIPISTPFELNTSAVDFEDPERMTYCWEQYDLGPATDLGMPIFTAPSFRSYPPTVLSMRTFPRMEAIVDNLREKVEVLPDYNRMLTFRCTVRDNHPGVGATVWEEVKLQSTDTAGPFLVQSPNADTVEWETGSYQEIVWDVANTNGSLVNCQKVNIKLSLDGGYSYPITLAAGVDNDGAQFVNLPVITTERARIRIDAADNIFFDISDANFSIIEPATPGYSLQITPSFQQLCSSAIAELTIETIALLDYDNLIDLEIIEDLPEGVAVQILPSAILPGTQASLRIDFSNAAIDEEITLTLRATSGSLDILYRTFRIDVVNNDFSSIVQTTPLNGALNLSAPTFTWLPSASANAYEIEIATSPRFGESTIVHEVELSTPTFTPDFVLAENTVFYWRVRGINECGTGNYTSPFVFRTEANSCNALQPVDVPFPLSGSGQQTKKTSILVEERGLINDLNIPIIAGSYEPINVLRFTLVSPAGTEAVLLDQKCGATSSFAAGFDDDAPEALVCPPTNGVVMRPQDPLSVFNGEDTQGLWTLRIDVVELGFGGGGGIDQWELEFCRNLNPSIPFLVNNATWSLPPNTRSQITSDFLLIQDENNTSDELFYTLVTAPANGTLYLRNETALRIGDQFRQIDVNSNELSYQHNGNDATEDKFIFTIEDIESGWFGTPTFNIKIDEDATVNTVDVELANSVQLFPNPVQGSELNVVIGKSPELFERMNIVNAQGQIVSSQSLAKTANRWIVNTANLAMGMYFLQLETQQGIVVKKFTVVQ
ncbi:MAG: reprolysin-like metallopeptidase, partial [Saprospiraceae bacterium]